MEEYIKQLEEGIRIAKHALEIAEGNLDASRMAWTTVWEAITELDKIPLNTQKK